MTFDLHRMDTRLHGYDGFLILFLLIFLSACGRSGPAPVTMIGTDNPEQTDSYYRVTRPTETVASVSKTTGVNLQALLAVNNISPPYRLRVGQQLVLPKPSTYKVKYDDTVFGIAQALNVSQSEIVTENSLKGPEFKLKLGQLLKIPSGYGANQVSVLGGEGYVVQDNTGSSADDNNNSVPYYAPPQGSGKGMVVSEDLAPLPNTASSSTSPISAPSYGTNSVGSSGLSSPSAPAVANSPVSAPVTPEPIRTASIEPAKRVASSPVSMPARSGSFSWPVQGNTLSSYGSKLNGQQNDGINIGVPRGTPVRAAENGIVAYSGNEIEGYGNLLLIRHDGGLMTAYAHMDKALVKRGDVISKGQTVGAVGSTGNVTTPQLHFEVRKGSKSVNPVDYLK